jgi:hypothetical protein
METGKEGRLFGLFNLRPLLVAAIPVTHVPIWRLPLLAPPVTVPASAVLPQETRSGSYDRGREVQGTGKRVAVAAPEVPIRVEAGGGGEELVVHEAGREGGDGRVDQVPVVRVRLRGLGDGVGTCEGVWGAGCSGGEER